MMKQIDYIEVYNDRKLINGVLYSRYVIINETPVGIPNGISFYKKSPKVKYVRLTSTDAVTGMMLRYECRDTQIAALLKLIEIKNLQHDKRPTLELRTKEKKYNRNNINRGLPSGICVTTRTINNQQYHRVTVKVFCNQKNKFIQKQLHAGRTDDADRLEETIKKALELRKSSLAHVASLTQTNASKGV